MNRLIIIGNGFDLAHNLKSSYKDFFKAYIYDILVDFNKNQKYNDDLLTLEFNSDTFYSFPDLNHFFNHDNSLEAFTEIMNRWNDLFKKQESFLFKQLFYIFKKERWVDIEALYFKLLKDNSNTSNDILMNFNKQFECLKTEFHKYLKGKIQYINTNQYNISEIQNCFYEKIAKKELQKHSISDIEVGETMVLNFNYTNIVNVYLKDKTILNNIHGTLDKEIVFGYGDEHDEEYLKFEKLNKNELFKFMKSFDYLKSDNYKDLLYFIEKDDYQVHIYGHSCGLSDKTMLNQIFENDKCQSIKIFYWERPDKTNDYVERTYEISRHFKNKVSLRNKLVPFNLSRPMPQPEMYIN